MRCTKFMYSSTTIYHLFLSLSQIFLLPSPFLQAILEFFRKFTDSISTDLQFVIDDISDEDTLAVGVSWHLGMVKNTLLSIFASFFSLSLTFCSRVIGLIIEIITEWKGKPFPFSKGCSFYRLDIVNGKRQIV